MNSGLLIQKYLMGRMTDPELQRFEQLLRDDVDIRREYRIAAAVECGLRETAFEREVMPVTASMSGSHSSPVFGMRTLLMLTAACVVAVLGIVAGIWWDESSSAPLVARLVSSENAAWESRLPTTPGSELSAGRLNLVTGVATIEFLSGVELVIEAPATLELISPMRGRLENGAAVISVPEPAIGFVLETPSGHVVDHGTQFAINVSGGFDQSNVEVIEGEVSVHLKSTGEEVRLKTSQSASIAAESLVAYDGPRPEESELQPANSLQLFAEGRSGTIIRNQERSRFGPQHVLMAKRTPGNEWDRRSYFSFDLTNVDLTSVETAELMLNLVPSEAGLATRLPVVNRFGIYGLAKPLVSRSSMIDIWEDAPSQDDGDLLGTFEIVRSTKQGRFGIQTSELLSFLRDRAGKLATLILVRETGRIRGNGPSLTHTFASGSHPEATGPMLELRRTKKQTAGR